MNTNNQNLFFDPDVEGESVRCQFLAFLNEFTCTDKDTNVEYYAYREEAAKMMKNKRTTIYVDFKHLIGYVNNGFELAEIIHLEYYK